MSPTFCGSVTDTSNVYFGFGRDASEVDLLSCGSDFTRVGIDVAGVVDTNSDVDTGVDVDAVDEDSCFFSSDFFSATNWDNGSLTSTGESDTIVGKISGVRSLIPPSSDIDDSFCKVFAGGGFGSSFVGRLDLVIVVVVVLEDEVVVLSLTVNAEKDSAAARYELLDSVVDEPLVSDIDIVESNTSCTVDSVVYCCWRGRG